MSETLRAPTVELSFPEVTVPMADRFGEEGASFFDLMNVSWFESAEVTRSAGDRQPICVTGVDNDVTIEHEQMLSKSTSAARGGRIDFLVHYDDLHRVGVKIKCAGLWASEDVDVQANSCIYRYYFCHNRNRYGTEKCDGYRIDAAETAALHALAAFYRDSDSLIASGNDQTRKAIIDTLIAKIKITGPDTIVPVFRFPQPGTEHDTPSTPPQMPPGR